MVKLSEDLSAWMNKYAATFDDAESVLFEVTSALLEEDVKVFPDDEEVVSPVTPEPSTVEVVEEPVAEEPIAQPAKEIPVQTTEITITYTFGDNGDWFVFEQSSMEPEDEVFIGFEFNFDNIWAELTKDLKDMDDWGRLNDDEWDLLIQQQIREDDEIAELIDEMRGEPIDGEFKDFVDSLDSKDVLEFTPAEIQEMFTAKTPDEFKLVLDKINDF